MAGEIYIYCVIFFLIAFLYSSIGHAGASGYLAIMALLSFPLDSIKPTSLILNITVALIASVKFISHKYFDKRIFLSFAITSIPASFIGGYIKVDPFWFKLLAGWFLILSAVLLLYKSLIKSDAEKAKPSIPYNFALAAFIGLVIGFFSGLIGVGGGIFLTPLLVFLNWTSLKNISGISALFIFINSIAGLLGHTASIQKIDKTILYWLLAVIAGAFIGTHFGIKKYNNKAILICLFLVLLSAGLKFLLVDLNK